MKSIFYNKINNSNFSNIPGNITRIINLKKKTKIFVNYKSDIIKIKVNIMAIINCATSYILTVTSTKTILINSYGWRIHQRCK